MESITSGTFTAVNSYFFGVNPVTAVALSVITLLTEPGVQKIFDATFLHEVLTDGQMQAVAWIASAIVTAAAVTACGLPLSSASALNLMILTLCQKGFIENVMRLREDNNSLTPKRVRRNMDILQAIVTTTLTASAPLFKTSVIATFVFSQIATSVAKYTLFDLKTLSNVLNPPLPPQNNEDKKRILLAWVDTQRSEPLLISAFKRLVREYQGDGRLEDFIAGEIDDLTCGRDKLRQAAIDHLAELARPKVLSRYDVTQLAAVAEGRLMLTAGVFPVIAIGLSALSSFTITPLTATGLAVVGLGSIYAVIARVIVSDIDRDEGFAHLRHVPMRVLLQSLMIKMTSLRK